MRRVRFARKFAVAALAIAPLLLRAQTLPAQKPAFEVVSVKRNTTNGPTDFRPRRSGNLVMMHNTQPFSIIFYAYHLSANYQVDGYAPLPDGWNWYDIDARASEGATDDQVRLMMQSLLAERFKLKVHRETKQVTGYELVTEKGKPKLQPSREGPMTVMIEGKAVTSPPGGCGISLWREGSHLICHAASMDHLVSSLTGQLRAPIVDGTGLTGTYDAHLQFLPDERKLDADAPPVASLADALREELGLRLERGKAPVEVLVIDHIEKPSEN